MLLSQMHVISAVLWNKPRIYLTKSQKWFLFRHGALIATQVMN